jgi:phosphate transport system ATP-binding protein
MIEDNSRDRRPLYPSANVARAPRELLTNEPNDISGASSQPRAPSVDVRAARADADHIAPATKLNARHVSFRYGDNVALEDVSVPLYVNMVTAFMGPSGCGKSTLLRLFNRMHDLYRDQHVVGEIFLDGENILNKHIDVNSLRSRVGMVFQQPMPFPMSIYDNVAFGIRIYESLSRNELDLRVEMALRRAALWDEVKDILSTSGLSLSGGQQQRLCIARMLAMGPEVILLDEPCSALDPPSAAKIEETINELRADHTIAIVTHNLQQAARVSDYTAFMYLGRMVEFGRTRQIFEAPRDKRTQRYVAGQFG